MSTSQIRKTNESSIEGLMDTETLRQIHAFMAHRTESGREPWAQYKLSAAGGNSGYSVGQIQVDLRGSEGDRATLVGAAASWLVKQGEIDPKEKLKWEQDVSEGLRAKATEGKLVEKNKDLINKFIASSEGKSLVDSMSRTFFDTVILTRLQEIFAHPSAKLLVKDPQFVAYAAKIANSGNGAELNAFLAGKEVELGGEPHMPIGRSKVIAPSALARAFIGELKQGATVTVDGKAVPLPTKTRIQVSAEGLFLLTSTPTAIILGKDPLRLTIPNEKKTRPRFREGQAEMGIVIEPNKKLEPEVVISQQEQKGNKLVTQLTFKDASVFSYAKVEISKALKERHQLLTPGAFFWGYASKNTFSAPFRKPLQDIYYFNPGQYQSLDAQPRLLVKTNDDLWAQLDPEGYLLPPLRKVIEDEHAIENRGQVRFGLKPTPLTRDRVEMYMRTNQAVMAAAVRLQPPAPQDAATPGIYYPNAQGGEASIRYRVDPKLLKNGQVGLMRLLREGRDAEIDVAPVGAKLPPQPVTIQPPRVWQKIDEARLEVRPSPIAPTSLSFARQDTPQPLRFDGPEPLQRPAGPSAEERAQIEADERMAVALAAFTQGENLRGMVAAEVTQQLKPPPGRGRFEEAVLCGYTIHSYA